jgi:hypothetical protein
MSVKLRHQYVCLTSRKTLIKISNFCEMCDKVSWQNGGEEEGLLEHLLLNKH